MRSTKYSAIALIFALIGCKMSPSHSENNVRFDPVVFEEIPDVHTDKKKLSLNQNEGKWYYKEVPFSGYAEVHNNEGTLLEKVGYFKGKKEGKAESWYEDHVLRKVAFYKENKLEGKVQVWSPSPLNILISESQYVYGVKHGVQQRWYTNGQIFRQLNLNMGKEEGMQKAWRENGKLYVNYEAKNGRIFGLKRSSLCYELEDEVVQY